MSDDADRSQDRAELEDELRRKYVKRAEIEVPFTGKCLNCGDPVKDPQRWCDVHCRNDWASRQKR